MIRHIADLVWFERPLQIVVDLLGDPEFGVDGGPTFDARLMSTRDPDVFHRLEVVAVTEQSRPELDGASRSE